VTNVTIGRLIVVYCDCWRVFAVTEDNINHNPANHHSSIHHTVSENITSCNATIKQYKQRKVQEGVNNVLEKYKKVRKQAKRAGNDEKWRE